MKGSLFIGETSISRKGSSREAKERKCSPCSKSKRTVKEKEWKNEKTILRGVGSRERKVLPQEERERHRKEEKNQNVKSKND